MDFSFISKTVLANSPWDSYYIKELPGVFQDFLQLLGIPGLARIVCNETMVQGVFSHFVEAFWVYAWDIPETLRQPKSPS